MEILAKDLCTVGNGRKAHIKRGDYSTLCYLGGIKSLDVPDLISMTEKAPEFCKSCLREFKIKEERETINGQGSAGIGSATL